MNDLNKLKDAINKKLSALDDQEVEEHIWYGKFLTMIEEIQLNKR
jgi:hypothetical protein